MARALDQIIKELDSVYNPQRGVYNSQITGLDPQQDAEMKGLEAQKQDSFQQITQGANRRGLFYSGLPIAEEQRYTGQNFLPAVANLRGKYANQRFGLMDALAKVTEAQSKQAWGIHQGELQVDEERRQFDERLAAQQRAEAENRAASERAARASAGAGGAVYGGGGATQQAAGGGREAPVRVNPADQQLYDQMFYKSGGGQWSDQDLVNDYNRTLMSARNGNQRDIQKIQFYHTFKSGLFGATQPSLVRINSGSQPPVSVTGPSIRTNILGKPPLTVR